MKWEPAAARTAIKTCVAFSIALAAALYLDWPVTPAVITTQMLQAAYLGITIRNSCTRLIGACVAGFLSLLLLGVFPQDRFMVILLYAVLTSFCMYMFQGSKNPYFWLIVMFGIPFIGLASGGHPESTFTQAVNVSSAFLLGGVAVLLANTIIWPNPVARAFEKSMAEVLQSIERRFALRLAALLHGDATHATEESRIQTLQLKSFTTLTELLDNAAVESQQIGRFHANYAHLVNNAGVLAAEMVGLSDALEACLASDTLRERIAGSKAFKSGLDRFTAELGALAEQMHAERDGSVTVDSMSVSDLVSGIDALGLSTADTALVTALWWKARDTWAVIQEVRQTLANVENTDGPLVAALQPPKREPFSFSSFRFRWSVVVGMAAFFAAHLWLIPQWPGGLKLPIIVPVLSTFFIRPWLGMQRAALTGMCLAIGISWMLYFLILPQLPNDFWVLGSTMMLFLFPMVYLQALSNHFWHLAGFIAGFSFCILVHISHPQVYSFAFFISGTIGLVTAIVFALGFYSLVQRMPPEREFRLRLRDFFDLCEQTVRESGRGAYGQHETGELRARRRALIEAYRRCIWLTDLLPHARVPQNGREHVETLCASMWKVAFRLDSMVRTRAHLVTDGTLLDDHDADVRHAIAEALGSLRSAAD